METLLESAPEAQGNLRLIDDETASLFIREIDNAQPDQQRP